MQADGLRHHQIRARIDQTLREVIQTRSHILTVQPCPSHLQFQQTQRRHQRNQTSQNDSSEPKSAVFLANVNHLSDDVPHQPRNRCEICAKNNQKTTSASCTKLRRLHISTMPSSTHTCLEIIGFLHTGEAGSAGHKYRTCKQDGMMHGGMPCRSADADLLPHHVMATQPHTR